MIYLNLQEDVKLKKQAVLLGDVAQLTGIEEQKKSKLMQLELYKFQEEKEKCIVLGIIPAR